MLERLEGPTPPDGPSTLRSNGSFDIVSGSMVDLVLSAQLNLEFTHKRTQASPEMVLSIVNAGQRLA